MTQYEGISVVLIEQEAPNNLAVFRAKVLSVNVHFVLVNFNTKTKKQKKNTLTKKLKKTF